MGSRPKSNVSLPTELKNLAGGSRVSRDDASAASGNSSAAEEDSDDEELVGAPSTVSPSSSASNYLSPGATRKAKEHGSANPSAVGRKGADEEAASMVSRRGQARGVRSVRSGVAGSKGG